MVKILVAHEARLNFKSASLNPAWEICAAAARGNTAQVAILLEANVSPDVQDYDSRTPMHLAACEDHLGVAQLLVARGANRSVIDRNGRTPCEDAKRCGKVQMHAFLELCSNGGGDIPSDGDMEKIKKLMQDNEESLLVQMSPPLSPGRMVMITDSPGGAGAPGASQLLLPAFLCSAAKENDVQRLSKLISTADFAEFRDVKTLLSTGDYDNRTPLMVASSACNVEVVEFLLKQGSRINDVDRWGSTALWEAITHEHALISNSVGASEDSEVVAKLLLSEVTTRLFDVPTTVLIFYFIPPST
jgi:hypothetical protein